MLANIGGPAPNKLDFLSVEHVICAKDREEGFIQKARQTVALSVWGARSYAALGIFGLNVWYCVIEEGLI